MTVPLDSAAQLSQLLTSGEATAVEVAQEALRRIEASEPAINAFNHVAGEAVIRQAEELDKRRSAGQPLGRLAGIPVAVKDVLCTTEMPTTCASRMLRDYMSPYDATVIAKLRAADALLIGKTNMDEFAMGASTENSACGPTYNPWDRTRTPGGSSGGAAAAVAACDVPLSLGSDTGGSIRQPAAFCGITGMKPTYGRVSRYGLVAFASSLDQIGPMSWDAADNALLMSVIAGHDPRDSTSLPAAVDDYSLAVDQADVRGMRIGVIRDQLENPGLDDDARQAVQAAIDVFRDAGAELIDVRFQYSRYWVPTYYIIAPCEASSNLSRYDGAHYGFRSLGTREVVQKFGPLMAMYCHSRDDGFGPEVKRRIMLGTYALSEGYAAKYYTKALSVRRLIRQDYDDAFAKVDILLGPVTPTPAFRLGEKMDDPLQMYLCDLFTVGANLAGLPALAVPAGKTADALPVGIQLQAAPLHEPALYRAAGAFQQATEHHTRRPPQ